MLPAQPSETKNQQKTLELEQIARIAQAAAQKYFSSNSYQPQQNVEQHQVSGEPIQEPINSLPPIITGLENFSPEQQAKIKEQLSAHFGAPLQPLQLEKNIQNAPQPEKYPSTDGAATESSRPFIPSVQVKSSQNENDNTANSQSTYIKKQSQ